MLLLDIVFECALQQFEKSLAHIVSLNSISSYFAKLMITYGMTQRAVKKLFNISKVQSKLIWFVFIICHLFGIKTCKVMAAMKNLSWMMKVLEAPNQVRKGVEISCRKNQNQVSSMFNFQVYELASCDICIVISNSP